MDQTATCVCHLCLFTKERRGATEGRNARTRRRSAARPYTSQPATHIHMQHARTHRERLAGRDGGGVAALEAEPERRVTELSLHDFADHCGLVAVGKSLKRHHHVRERTAKKG